MHGHKSDIAAPESSFDVRFESAIGGRDEIADEEARGLSVGLMLLHVRDERLEELVDGFVRKIPENASNQKHDRTSTSLNFEIFRGAWAC
jgi:hypothetical protein